MTFQDCYTAFVNLDSRQDRRNHMLRVLPKIEGWNVGRMPGILPNEITEPRVEVMRQRTPGAIGCHFAQMTIVDEAQRLSKHAIVFEDDLIFCSDFKERMDYIFMWAETHEWDVIWLGATFHSPAFWHPRGPSGMRPNCSASLGKDCEPTDDPRMIRTYGAFSTHAYLVNNASIPKIKALFNKHLHESIGIDWLYIKLQPQLKCFSFVPGCVKQYDNESNIGTGITKWSGFLKLNGTFENSAYVWQDKMSDFDPTKFQWK
jgi:GR25 family glycosyltransferase involved in LPS biosynthesis